MRIITGIILSFVFFFSPASAQQQDPRGGRGQRGEQRPPATYYGGGVWGPGARPDYHPDQRWRGVPGGRWWRGQYFPPGVGPCWTYLPIVGWTWTCGP